ncbi:Transcriptional regulator, AcrR family [hydrothermal vent metagenome]|uniref:Transcriptional regulator, AcrR family n=1 Tax=hydrothermal vent metagenome TaxID=652676 RepID=A0A3B0SFZ4_9ZZZZ
MKRTSDATRARIFEAARAEFARFGIAGARVDRIAENAPANKARIYEYFGDKETLFALVLEIELERLGSAIAVPDDPIDIPGYVRDIFDYHSANPDLVRLLYWEALQFSSQNAPREEERREFYAQRAAYLARAQQDGVIPGSVDPRHLHFLLLSLATSWFGLPQLARMHMDDDPTAPQNLHAQREHVVWAVCRILGLDDTQDTQEGCRKRH